MEEGMEHFEDMDTDALAEVFGPEKKTRTRGLTSNASKKQLKYVAIGKALLQQSGSSNSNLETQMNGMQFQMNKMNDVLMAFINQASGNSVSCAQPTPPPPSATNTPQAEVGSSSAHRTSQPTPQNLMNLFETTHLERRSPVNPKVTLLIGVKMQWLKGLLSLMKQLEFVMED
ncbi:hypothetical protein AQUCO_05200044v1 [Aquilegia coerulea]|uniref:Uncharacterized protein n=1 Tax=Aquilegia coerulea TaxID=218851 RepID=A0A2G5CIS8_AQUCA|nr:hypothetical protein AQUCO_05200044v1 [Aquilegia coerulea]